jgi:thioesterase domain-containing protein
MNRTELQEYLYKNIPLSKAIGIEVQEISAAGVTLFAPLAQNVNHQGTVFAGSASAVALLSAWALLSAALKMESIRGRGVVYNNSMSYDLPIAGDFTAFAPAPDAAAWQRFKKTLRLKGRARIRLQATLYSNGQQVGKMEGDFVGLAE